MTKKQLRLINYNDIIKKNKKLFSAGKSISRKKFISLFKIKGIVDTGTYEDVQRSNLKLVAVQTDLNMLMRENGLYLQSEDYYSKFSIVNKDRTVTAVMRYNSEVDINSHCVTRLEAKLTERIEANTWGTYEDVANAIIKRMGNYKETQRHKRIRERMRLI